MTEIFVPNDLYRMGKLRGPRMAVYITLRAMCCSNGIYTDSVITINEICYRLFGSIEPSRAQREVVQDAVDLLVKQDILLAKVIGKYFIIESNTFDFNEGQFFASVYLEDVIKIMCSDYKCKYDLVNYYVWIMGSRKHKIGFLTMQYFETKLSICRATVISYNQMLENLQILYIKHSWGGSLNEDGNYKGVSNKYCHYSDKNLLYDSDSDNAITSRERKSLAGKYRMVQNGKRYSPAEEYRILKYVNEYNEEENTKAARIPGYKPVYKDASILALH